MGGCGVTMHAILPVFESASHGKIVFGIISSILGLILIERGGFHIFQRLMAVCIGIMSVTVIASAILLAPDWGEIIKGLLIPSIPDAKEGGIADWLADANEGYGVDIVLEMSGAPSAIDSAFRGVRNGGRITLFGIPSSPVRIDVAESMIFKNLTVLALNGRRIFDTWYKTRWMMESGVVNLKPLITHEMGIDRIEEAMQLLADGDACKIILRPNTNMNPQAEESKPLDLQDPNIHGRIMHR